MFKSKLLTFGILFLTASIALAGYQSQSLAQPNVEFKSADEFLKYKEALKASNSEFAEPIQISRSETGNVSNSATFRSGDLIFVAWEGDLNGKKDIFASISYDNARSFDPPFLLSVNSSGDSIKPAIMIVNGSFYAAWENHVDKVSNVVSSSSMDNGLNFITYLQTNATNSGPVLNATDPRFTAVPVSIEHISNVTFVTQEGYPLLTWKEQTANSTDEWGHGRPW